MPRIELLMQAFLDDDDEGPFADVLNELEHCLLMVHYNMTF